MLKKIKILIYFLFFLSFFSLVSLIKPHKTYAQVFNNCTTQVSPGQAVPNTVFLVSQDCDPNASIPAGVTFLVQVVDVNNNVIGEYTSPAATVPGKDGDFIMDVNGPAESGVFSIVVRYPNANGQVITSTQITITGDAPVERQCLDWVPAPPADNCPESCPAHDMGAQGWRCIGIYETSPLCKLGDQETDQLDTALGCISITSVVNIAIFLLNWAIGLGGGVAFILIVFAGYQIITASGDPKQLQGAKELLFAALFGEIFIIFSVFLLRIIGVSVLGIF